MLTPESDVIIVTETWLLNSTADGKLDMSKGGGILVAIKIHIPIIENSCEKIIIGVFYFNLQMTYPQMNIHNMYLL